MLASIRKFSSTVFAKILLFIIVIPFVFWGMGPLFEGGSQNIIVKIDNKKYSTNEFVEYVSMYAQSADLNEKIIKKHLSNFIGDKIFEIDIKKYGIILSDESLGKIIKNEKLFKKDGKFSRVEYEKFLVKNSLNAATVEKNISKQVKKEHLFRLIGGGIKIPNFLVNNEYNFKNQSRDIEIINMNKIFEKKIPYSENQIEDYYNKNKSEFVEDYRKIEFIKLDPKNLTGENEFTDLFFKRIDEIDDLIVEGKDLEFILKKFELKNSIINTLNSSGFDKNSQKIKNLPNKIVEASFKIDNEEPLVIIEHDNKYYVIELLDIKSIQSKLDNKIVQKKVVDILNNIEKRKLLSEIISKLNSNDFTKSDFDRLANQKNIQIKKIKINNQYDDKNIQKELIDQIYEFSEKQISLVADPQLIDSYLVYINKINNVSISKGSEDFEKYANLSEERIKNSLYSTYDTYIKNKYDININYKALDSVKNYLK